LLPVYPLLTRDPISGGELIVTRLACLQSGVVIEGNFSLGWIARLTPEQLEFVGQLLRNRGNVQRLAAELGIAYNTARNRLDEIVVALEGATETPPPALPQTERLAVLDRLAAGEVALDEALRLLDGE
jgi:hypothetical protein